MKREAVQEERQRGAKMLPKQTESDLNQANSVRDLTVERLMEAEQKSETRSGDNAIPYLRVGSNSEVQAEYKVCTLSYNSLLLRNFVKFSVCFLYMFIRIGSRFAPVSNGEQTIIPID